MQGVHLRKYGVQTTIDFELYEIDGVDLRIDWVPVAADCEVMKDAGTSTQCTNTATDEGSTYSIILTTTEMEAARLVLKIVDAATKVFLDKVIVVETYGNASAMHAFDLDIATQDVNTIQISGDTTAADNLEAMYDQTGYIDDTAPASRSQVNAIGSGGGGALNFANEADNIDSAIKSISFVGGETSGTNASANTEDGTYHNITHSGNAFDIVYQFDIGGDRGVTSLVWTGYLDGNNDVASIQVYNGSGWDTVATIVGQNGIVNQEINPLLLSTHTGTGADLGKVFVRLVTSGQTSPDLFTDQLVVEAVSLGSTLGFVGGAVWLDTNNGTSGTGEGIGTISIPSDNIADARTIADANNLRIIHSIPGSSYTLAQSFNNFEFLGHAYTIALGGQSIDGSYFFDANISGTGTYSSNAPTFEDCPIGDITLPPSIMRRCYLFGDITNSGIGDWFINHCVSRKAGGAAVIFNFGTAIGNTNLNLRSWAGRIQLESMGDTGTDAAEIEGWGELIEGTCTGGIVTINGNFTVSGISNLTLSDDARIDVDQVNAQADLALSDYDGPTRTELTSDINSVITEVDANETKIDTIDTVVDGIQTDLSNATDGLGALKTLIDIVNTDLGNGTDGLSALKTLIDTVNTDLGNGTDGLGALKALIDAVDTVSDAILAMLDDTRGEPGQAALPVNPDAMTKLDYLYKLLRNKKDNDGTTTQFYDDAGTTVDHKQTTNESGGTVTKEEIASGP